jgi:hypothetical protein
MEDLKSMIQYMARQPPPLSSPNEQEQEQQEQPEEQPFECLNDYEDCFTDAFGDNDYCLMGNDATVQLMMEHCAPACQTCHLLEERVNCREFWMPHGEERRPSLMPGDLHHIFERLAQAGSADENDMGQPIQPLWGDDDDDDDDHLDHQDDTNSHGGKESSIRLLYKDETAQETAEWLEFARQLEPVIHSRPAKYSPKEETTTTSSLIDEDDEDLAAQISDPNYPPWIVTLENFLSPEEAARFIELGYQQGYERSGFYSEEPDENGMYDDNTVDEFRTSENTWYKYPNDPMTLKVMQRISKVIGIPVSHTEDYQLLKYDVGQQYGYHHDYHEDLLKAPYGARILTFFLYLNDMEEDGDDIDAGGGTRFPDLGNLTITPKRGRAVIWPNVRNDQPDEMEEWTFHEAMPVLKGQKFGSNIWYHQYDYQTPAAHDC